jgi:hypothetical protein
MKIVMHELDYDMDDNDLEFLEEINQYMKSERMFIFRFFLFFFFYLKIFRSSNNDRRRI